MPHTQAFIGIFVERTAKRHPGLPRKGLTECAINESYLAPEEKKSFFLLNQSFLDLVAVKKCRDTGKSSSQKS